MNSITFRIKTNYCFRSKCDRFKEDIADFHFTSPITLFPWKAEDHKELQSDLVPQIKQKLTNISSEPLFVFENKLVFSSENDLQIAEKEKIKKAKQHDRREDDGESLSVGKEEWVRPVVSANNQGHRLHVSLDAGQITPEEYARLMGESA